ncbi:hypothetical protein MBGDF03_00475 [Thermoplasmatales archaeon SCGC AB-540-F20]|nr:hypothetical protein MBGDF03_00475 [Thermoplasmatales archaeon SCGC AB-540-F20]
MKNKIKEEIMEWYESLEDPDDESLEDFIELVMDKTTDFILEEIKKQFKDEFLSGNLKHDFVISPDYYLELKLKEVKQNFFKDANVDLPDDEY